MREAGAVINPPGHVAYAPPERLAAWKKGLTNKRQQENVNLDKNEISHDNFDRRSSDLTIAAKANYVSEIVGRNYITAEGIVNAWLESETHRKAIEGDYMYTAVSAKADSEGVFYFTQLFYR